MNRILTMIIFFMLVSVAWPNPESILNEENLPPDFVATYDVHKGNIRVGKMLVSLRKVGDELIYKSNTSPVGIAAFFLGQQEITDRAVLKLIGTSYRTIEFKHEMKHSDKNRNQHYVFDWENNKANVQYKDRENTLDIMSYTFDNFSTQLLLMRKPDVKSTEYIYSVISKGRLKEYVYKLEKNETLETKLGKLSANKYVREKKDEKKTTYLGWYAESLNYIPIKLDKMENGKIDVSIQITNVSWP